MANKNDTSDLIHFFSVLGGIIVVLTFLLSFGYALADRKYGKDIRFLEAKATCYIQQQWSEAKRVDK